MWYIQTKFLLRQNMIPRYKEFRNYVIYSIRTAEELCDAIDPWPALTNNSFNAKEEEGKEEDTVQSFLRVCSKLYVNYLRSIASYTLYNIL